MNEQNQPRVGIIMGSNSDWPTMEAAYQVCCEFEIPCEVRVVSAHRTPDEMARYAKSARKRGLQLIIAGAGGAAHLPGMVASHTPLPVIGVPVESKTLKGIDSLLSIVQMPAGIPVATVAIGGAKNAGLLAVSILGISHEKVQKQIVDYRNQMAKKSQTANRLVQKELAVKSQSSK
ncbi:5-(carboxyamino)imidazole ribonucleotide mutase [bacterium]|nr:5-(carboxyamino)imidazole ribonucleotide mutase [bacterium]